VWKFRALYRGFPRVSVLSYSRFRRTTVDLPQQLLYCEAFTRAWRKCRIICRDYGVHGGYWWSSW